jgi:hypothetical protein
MKSNPMMRTLGRRRLRRLLQQLLWPSARVAPRTTLLAAL